MKAELRISIKDYHRTKNLNILLVRPLFPSRQFQVWMKGEQRPVRARAVSVTRLVAAVGRALVKALETRGGGVAH
jgi:hypothetical protein